MAGIEQTPGRYQERADYKSGLPGSRPIVPKTDESVDRNGRSWTVKAFRWFL